MARVVPIVLCLAACVALSCSGRVVLLDGRIPPEAAVPADLPSPELRFCSGAQKVILDGQEIRVLSTTATAQKQAPSEMGYVPMQLTLVVQLPSQQRRVLQMGITGNTGSFHDSQCCPTLSEMGFGVRLTLYDCLALDCQVKQKLDEAFVNSDTPDLVVDGWCGYNWGQPMSLCFKSTTLHPEKHPYLKEVQVFVPAVDVEVKPWN